MKVAVKLNEERTLASRAEELKAALMAIKEWVSI